LNERCINTTRRRFCFCGCKDMKNNENANGKIPGHDV